MSRNRFTPHAVEQADGRERPIDGDYQRFLDEHIDQALSGGSVSYDRDTRGPRTGERRKFKTTRAYEGHS
ncbi:MAG: hypothetical protein ACJAYC_002743 [Halieaceae bacterium]|jgi:hypothetical protein